MGCYRLPGQLLLQWEGLLMLEQKEGWVLIPCEVIRSRAHSLCTRQEAVH